MFLFLILFFLFFIYFFVVLFYIKGGTRLTGVIWSTPDIIPRNLSTINGNYSELFHAADIYPTLLDAAGISYNLSKLDGVSQWDGILGKYENNNNNNNIPQIGSKYNFRDYIYYGRNANTYPCNDTAYRYREIKVLNSSGGPPDYWYPPSEVAFEYNEIIISSSNSMNNNTMYQLYNLTNDPTEHNDISSMNTELTQQMITKMEALKATGIPQASNDPSCKNNITHPVYPTVGGVWEPWC